MLRAVRLVARLKVVLDNANGGLYRVWAALSIVWIRRVSKPSVCMSMPLSLHTFRLSIRVRSSFVSRVRRRYLVRLTLLLLL